MRTHSTLLVSSALVIILFAIPVSSQHEAVEWRMVAKWPSPGLFDITFSSARNGWALSKSTMLRTHDGGTTWQHISRPISRSRIQGGIAAIQFVNNREGFALENNGVWRTIDGGENWIEIAPNPLGPDGGEVWGIRFLSNASIGWAYGGVYEPAKLNQEAPNDAVIQKTPGDRFIIRPALFRTIDEGMHWRRSEIHTDPQEVVGYHVVDASLWSTKHAVAVTELHPIYTYDSGVNWHIGDVLGSNCAERYSLDDLNVRIKLVYSWP